MPKQPYQFKDIPATTIRIRGRASWPRCQEPSYTYDPELGDYSCDLVFTPEELEATGLPKQLEKLNAEGLAFFKKHHRGVKQGPHWPIKDEEKKQATGEKDENGEDVYEYVPTGRKIVKISLKAHKKKKDSAKLIPNTFPVIDKYNRALTEDLLSGADVLVYTNARCYFIPGTGASVSLKIGGVMMFENGTPYNGPTAEDMFGDVIEDAPGDTFAVDGDADTTPVDDDEIPF